MIVHANYVVRGREQYLDGLYYGVAEMELSRAVLFIRNSI